MKETEAQRYLARAADWMAAWDTAKAPYQQQAALVYAQMATAAALIEANAARTAVQS